MPQATLTSKGQITIPKSIRDALHLSTGEKLEFILGDKDTMVVRPVTRKVDEVFGLLRKYRKPTPVSVEEMNDAIRNRMTDHG